MNEKQNNDMVANATNDTHAVKSNAKAMRSDRLLVRMNHEIRTAANVILGLTEIIRESELDQNLRDNISAVSSSAMRLLKESAELIDLGRAEQGSLQLFSTSFKLQDMLQQAMNPMWILANAKGVTLKFYVSDPVPLAVNGDPARLRQILMTLVRASIERLERGEITVNVNRCSNEANEINLKFSIADNGPRIPPERMIHMFNRALGHETAASGEWDQDLMFARDLAQMMGGDLWAEVEPKRGAIFNFHVNLRPAPMADVHQLCKRATETRTDRRPLKILVADDSVDTLRVIRAFLKDAPWGIETADNGRIALEMAVNNSYDLILMDLDMPEMNGFIATREIRLSERLHELPAVPIVALTAHNEAEAASRSIEAGCTAHATKPIHKTALIETIQRYAFDSQEDFAFALPN
jgi:CheY-like chemotaxis protein